MAYRSKDSYLGNTPEARQRQLSGLRRGRVGKATKKHRQKTQAVFVPKVGRRELSKMNIIDFATNVLHVSFADRPAQEVILCAQYGLPMTDEQVEIFKKITGNSFDVYESGKELDNGNWVCGARGGKSTLVSIIALYETICREHRWRRYLQTNETGYCVVVATKLRQAYLIIATNCLRLLEQSDIYKDYFQSETLEEIELKNNMKIVSSPCSSNAYRGVPIPILILDEIAHFHVEGKKADKLIHEGLRPRQSQFVHPKYFKISTPAAKQGIFWTEYDEGFDVPNRLTIQVDTLTMNPLANREFIEAEYRRDPEYAQREYGAIFAESVSGFFQDCTEQLISCFTLPPGQDFPYKPGFSYFAAMDQSGLSGNDKWGFAICHRDNTDNKIYVDITREWASKDLSLIMTTIKSLCNEYNIRQVACDRYARGFVEQLLLQQGLEMVTRELLPGVYIAFKTLARASRLALPEYGPLRTSLLQTMAYYGRSQTLSICHERNRDGHADLADAVVTAATRAAADPGYGDMYPVYHGATAGPQTRIEDSYNPLRWEL